MARKFNIGRQGEQLLNDEWHKLFMSLKLLNYDRYRGISDPQPERQTDIPERALRINSGKNMDLLETYYPDTEDEWRPLFQGYFHPASAIITPGDDFPAYQLGIDPQTGAIKYWEPDTRSWIVARANDYHGDVSVYNGLNFQLISDLTKAVSYEGEELDYCPVPYIKYGRLFSLQEDEGAGKERRGRYLMSESQGNEQEGYHGYYAINECAIIPGSEDTGLSWVHVNASKVSKMEKRLIKIKKDENSPDYGFIRISSSQTEFYGFVAGNRQGTLLLKDQDFTDVVGGIELKMPTDYDYIYSITYTFDDYPSNEGYVIAGRDIVGENNQVYVGQSECPIALFMDGLALEQTDEIGNEIYLHDEREGVITFTDDEDADIIRNMQMTTLAIPKRTEEFIIAYNGSGCKIDEDNKTVTLTLDKANNISNYKHPMVFCSGLGLQETEIFEDVIINGNEITIKEFLLPYMEHDNTHEPVKGFVADICDSYMSKGRLDQGFIYDKNISEGSNYIIFANGLLMTPTNGDIIVNDGQIQIIGANEEDFGEIDYVLFEVDDHDDNKLGIIFDDTVSYHSIRIDDHGAPDIYNDCNSAIVYIGNGIIIDQAAIERPINSIEGFYKNGQIIKAMDEYGNGQYYIYDYADEEPRQLNRANTEDRLEIETIENFIGYYSTTGSIHLLGDDDAWNNCKVNYYAYSYANMIDEPMIAERKGDLIIPPTVVKGEKATYAGRTSRMHVWNHKCNSLSTYINGLILDNIEVDTDGDGVIRDFELTYPKFYVPTDTDYYGDNVDILEILKSLYNKYNEVPVMDLKESRFNIDKNYIDDKNTIPISKYFASHQLFLDALELAKYIYNDMQKESVSCVIEKIERDEFIAAYRDYIDLDVAKNKDHTQIFGSFNDTIEADWMLAPATVNVYLNGVLLNPLDYCKFNNNKIMFNVDVCGIQQLPSLERIESALPDHLSEKDKNYMLNAYKNNPKNVLRVIEDSIYYVPTDARDTILVEKRSDTSIKTVTYDILAISYNTHEFSQDYYDIPESLVNTGDYIKIYINGVRYEGDYKLTNTGGVKGIRLTQLDLILDPLYQHFLRYPGDLEAYKAEHEKDYERVIDKITFEWR